MGNPSSRMVSWKSFRKINTLGHSLGYFMLDHSFIYGLVCPTDGRIRYVGQTKSKSIKERLGDHLRESFYVKPVYSHKERWIRKVHTLNSQVTVVELERLDTILDEVVDAAECFWMAHFPDLTNSRTGGRKGNTMSLESRNRLSEARKGAGNPMWGKMYTLSEMEKQAVCDRLRANGKWAEAMQNPDFRKKQAEKQQKNIWLIVRQDGEIICRLRSASEVSRYFNEIIGQACGVANAKNARRRMRPIGKQHTDWFFVCYEPDLHSLLESTVFNEPVLLGPAAKQRVPQGINDVSEHF